MFNPENKNKQSNPFAKQVKVFGLLAGSLFTILVILQINIFNQIQNELYFAEIQTDTFLGTINQLHHQIHQFIYSVQLDDLLEHPLTLPEQYQKITNLLIELNQTHHPSLLNQDIILTTTTLQTDWDSLALLIQRWNISANNLQIKQDLYQSLLKVETNLHEIIDQHQVVYQQRWYFSLQADQQFIWLFRLVALLLLLLFFVIALVTYRFVRRHQIIERELRQSQNQLEKRVAERTVELQQINEQLQQEIFKQRQTEIALKQSEQDYRGLFEHAHDAIIIFSPDDESVLNVNQHACKLYGFSKEEFISLSLKEITKDIPEGELKIKQTLAKHQKFYSAETVQYCKDGTEMFLEFNATTITYRGQAAILTINRDITERKQAERLLQEAHDNLEKRVALRTAELLETNEALQNQISHRKQTQLALEIIADRRKQLLGAAENMLSSLTVNGVVQHILDNLKAAVSYDATKLYWVNQLDNNLYLFEPVYLGEEPLGLQLGREPIQSGLVQQAIDLKQPLLVNQTSNSPTADSLNGEIEQDKLAKHIVVVLLRTKQNIYGALKVIRHQDPPFSNGDFEMVQLFATQGSIAVQNAYLFDKADQQTKRLTVVNKLTRDMTSLLSVTELCRMVAEVLHADLGYFNISIFIFDPVQNNLMIKYNAGYYTKILQGTEYRQNSGEGIIGYAAQTGEIYVVNDTRQNADFFELTDMAIRSELAIPLKVNGDLIGVLNIDSDHLNTFNHENVALLTTVGRHLATAIEKANLFTEIKQRVEQLEKLRQAGLTLTAALELNQVFAEILHVTLSLVPAQNAHIFLYDADADTLKFGYAFWLDQHPQEPFSEPRSDGLTYTVARRGETIIISDIRKHALFKSAPASWSGSLIGLPLKVRGRVVGVLNIARTQKGNFSEADLQMLHLMADQAAVVVEKAHLYEQMQQEINERKRIEVDLQRAKEVAEAANKAKSQFLANMSHELRTPLNGILGYTQLLKRDDLLMPAQSKAINTIQESGQYLLTLLNDILDLSKIEANKIILYPTTFYLINFLQTLIDIFQARAIQKGIIFYCQKSDNLPPIVQGDEKRLRQVLINLLGNAVKFTDKGQVILDVSYQNQQACFKVIDTGIGIPAANLTEIFQPFQQIDNQGDRQIDGTGLGLSISKRLVKIMGGSLEVESNLGQGSSFWFQINLPAIEGVRGPLLSPKKIIGFKGETYKLLIVDDRLENRTILNRWLTPLGFQIAEAVDGEEALHKTAEFQPQAILMDIRMPKMDGLTAIRHLRKLTDSTKLIIIAISAGAFNKDKTKSITAGANSFLSKPVDFDELLNQLHKHLHLEWVYQTDLQPVENLTNKSANIVMPPTEILTVLEQAVYIGDIKTIRQKIIELEQMQEKYQPFTQQLKALTQRYQLKKIRDLLKLQVDLQ